MNAVVKTRQGEVWGILIDGVYTFKGIPYSALLWTQAPLGVAL